MRRPLPPPPELADAVRSGERRWLARAITLVESRRDDHREAAAELLELLLPHAGDADRIGMTGVPGVGKSTFIDQFGSNLTEAGHRVAVLAVDPTSSRSGGAILGDKTRMARLAVDPSAFVRPSPAGAALGGVARTTRETMVLCEAAGYDVILVETVGVGQSETTVSEMVDIMVVLMLAGAGDELQGIKKGILELADLIAINKADGDNRARASAAAADYRQAIRLMTPASATWTPPVLTCSALENEGLGDLWEQITIHRTKLEATGERQARRQAQQVRWMWTLIENGLRDAFARSAPVADRLGPLTDAVRAGEVPATAAAEELLERFGGAAEP